MLAAAPPGDVPSFLDRLAAATSDQQAAFIERQILAKWHSAETPAVQLLVDRAARKAKGAAADLDAALILQPELADLWRLRAEAGDGAGAAADLAQALAREPRCFPALADLSRLEEGRHDDKAALAAWQQFLKIDPRAAGGAERLQLLTRKVFGQPT